MPQSIRPLLLSVAVLIGGAGAVAAMHNHLVKSTPSKDEELAAPPALIRLWFAEKPEVRYTSITLLTADSAKIATSPVRATDDTLSVAVDLMTKLAPGNYLVSWRTAGADGHAVRGTFPFKVEP